MANTVIQLKYSEGTATPPSLNIGEPAYSNNSGKLYIGRATGSPVAIGGKYYTDLVDAATDANTVSTIVKRDASGIFSAPDKSTLFKLPKPIFADGATEREANVLLAGFNDIVVAGALLMTTVVAIIL
jgi:hypothetical protein